MGPQRLFVNIFGNKAGASWTFSACRANRYRISFKTNCFFQLCLVEYPTEFLRSEYNIIEGQSDFLVSILELYTKEKPY